MTVPGGDSGEKPQHEQSQQNTGSYPPPSGYPPPAYPPPGYPQPGPPPPGYAPQGYAGSSYPPPPPPYPGSQAGYGPPYAGSYPDYGQSPGTNTLAIASLVASLIGWVFCLSGVVGIVLGAIALSQIKQTRQQGHGLAVAGIAVGVAVVLVYLVVFIPWAMH